ncbi:MAG: hypothetical protein H8E44_03845 [Planctomycetes bacterium]|nr:hypothetical protein [Planctomycetota bacterium]
MSAVYRVYPRAWSRGSPLGDGKQRVKVIARLSDDALQQIRELGVGADYRVRVRIFMDGRSDAVLVPRSALFRNSDSGWQVFTVRNGRARLRDVTVGLMNDQDVEVTGGLEEGETVILAPENDMMEGIRVRTAT